MQFPTVERRVKRTQREKMDALANEHECRAWPIARGTLTRGVAGRMHTDIERGFIRAELLSYDDLDGDVIHFRFNV